MQNFPIACQNDRGPSLDAEPKARQPGAASGFDEILSKGSQGDDPGRAEVSGRETKTAAGSETQSGEAQPAGLQVGRQSERNRQSPEIESAEGSAACGESRATAEENGVAAEELSRVLEILQELGLSGEDRALVRKLATDTPDQLSDQELLRLKEILTRAQALLDEQEGRGEEISRFLRLAAARLKQISPDPQIEKGLSRPGDSGKAGAVSPATADKSGSAGLQRLETRARGEEQPAETKEADVRSGRGKSVKPSDMLNGQDSAVKPEQAREKPVHAPSGLKSPERAPTEQQMVRNGVQQAAAEHASASGSKSPAGGGESGQGKERGHGDWQGLWRSLSSKGPEESLTDSATKKAFQDKADSLIQQVLTKSDQQGPVKGEAAASKGLRHNVLKQVENGLLRNLGQGKRELTLKLHPPELGTIKVTLQVQGKDLNALIKTSSSETGRMLQQQVSSLQHLFEQQGLKVQKLDVQTFVQQDGSGQQWLGEHGHNQAQQQRDRMEKRSWLGRWRQGGLEEAAEAPLEQAEGAIRRGNTPGTISTVA